MATRGLACTEGPASSQPINPAIYLVCYTSHMYDPGVLYNVVIVISLDDLFGILFSIDQYVLFARVRTRTQTGSRKQGNWEASGHELQRQAWLDPGEKTPSSGLCSLSLTQVSFPCFGLIFWQPLSLRWSPATPDLYYTGQVPQREKRTSFFIDVISVPEWNPFGLSRLMCLA